jgi:hypothetical protein
MTKTIILNILMYTIGATGHPWWIDLEMLTYLDINPFVIIHVFAFFK